MLRRMFIKNFALIDSLEIDFHAGFNVLTGETGAGKSIIIDAMDVVMGGQGLTDFIRSGADASLVEALFSVEGNQVALTVLEEYGYNPEPGEDLILSRELVRSGKNTCRVNGKQVNLSVYREICKSLVDIYGQHHQQSLLEPQKHVNLLDEFGGKKIVTLKQELSMVFNELNELQNKLNNLETGVKEQGRMVDIYKYQFDEIAGSNLVIGEDDALSEEKKILVNAEKLSFISSLIYEILYESNTQKVVTDQLVNAINHLKEISHIDRTLIRFHETLETCLYQVEETAREIKSYSEKQETDPSKLQEVDNRLDLINQLKRKYGDSIKEIIDYQQQASVALEELTNYQKEIAITTDHLAKARENYYRLNAELHDARTKVAEDLKLNITSELQELNMPHVSFDISIGSKTYPTAYGTDEVEFLISPNKGEPLKQLAKIVSGGEMSRIMLAFKSVLAKVDTISTLIFDEVDAGVGGSALQAVARKLALIGRSKQVICVTHAPQIAAHGHSHYSISKTIDASRTVTKVRELDYGERIDEIARMLTGGKVTPVARKHAAEILKKQELF